MNCEIASGLSVPQYGWKVRPGGDWDLKNNNNTIFGLAWLGRKEYGNTTFSAGDYTFENAAGVGNYHAGYTGFATGTPAAALWLGAGIAEQMKNLINLDFGLMHDQLEKSHIGPIPFPPFGDGIIDFKWNTKGMLDYEKRR